MPGLQWKLTFNIMSNELLLNIYLMNEKRVCLAFKSTDRMYKVVNLREALPFVGCIKQLSLAIDTGARQKPYTYPLCCADGLERLLKCSFVQEVVALELWFKERLKFYWRGTAKEFRAAVDGMVLRLPKFF
jgi:hypothetical protein